MLPDSLDRHLSALDVQVHPFMVCEVGPGYRLMLPPMDAPLIHYVLAGSGVLCTDDGACVPISPHSLVFVPRGKRSFLAVTRDEPNEVSAMESCGPLGDGLIKFTAGRDLASDDRLVTACGTISADLLSGAGLFDRLREPLVEQCRDNPAIQHAFSELLQELSDPRFGTRAITETLVKQCLVLVLRAQLDRGEVGLQPLLPYQDKRLGPAVKAMLDRPADNHSLESLAVSAGMGRSLFAERFTEVFGETPIEFLRQLRLHHAARILRTTDMPVALVARAVGYSSRSYFSRAFRAAFGVDPRGYREKIRAKPGGPSGGGGFAQQLMRRLSGMWA